MQLILDEQRELTAGFRRSPPRQSGHLSGNRTFRADLCAVVLNPFIGQALAQGHMSELTPVTNLFT